MNPRCNGTDWLCGKCKKLYPSLAASLAEKKRSRGNNNNGRRTGRIAGAIVTGAIGAYGATTDLPQSGYAPLRDEAKSSVQNERTNRARTQRGATRDQGNRNRGSGQR